MMALDVPDEDNTLKDVAVDSVEDAEVPVVRADEAPLVAPGYSGGQILTASVPGLTRNCCRLPKADKLLLCPGLYLRRTPELNTEHLSH